MATPVGEVVANISCAVLYPSPIMTCSTQKLKNAAGAAVIELAKDNRDNSSRVNLQWKVRARWSTLSNLSILDWNFVFCLLNISCKVNNQQYSNNQNDYENDR